MSFFADVNQIGPSTHGIEWGRIFHSRPTDVGSFAARFTAMMIAITSSAVKKLLGGTCVLNQYADGKWNMSLRVDLCAAGDSFYDNISYNIDNI